MNSKWVLLLVAAIAIYVVAAGKGKKGGWGHKWQCKGKDLKMSEEVNKTMTRCWKELRERKKAESDDSSESEHVFPDDCFTACKFEGTGSVKEGKVDMDHVNKWIEGEFPSDAQDDLKKGLKKCADKVNGTLSTDNKCKSYSKLGMCSFKIIMKTCMNKHEDDA